MIVVMNHRRGDERSRAASIHWAIALLATFVLVGTPARSASAGSEAAENDESAASGTTAPHGRASSSSTPPNAARLSDRPTERDSFDDPVAGPREMLRLFQIGESQLELFSDGEPLSQDGLATLMRLLYRAPSFPRHKVDRWAYRDFDVADIRSDPNRYRGTMLALAGSVVASDRVAVLPRDQERFGFDHFFRLVVRTLHFDAIIYCRRLPKPWCGQGDGQHVRAVGMFVKTGVTATETPATAGDRSEKGAPLVVVTDTPAWHPTTIDSEMRVTDDHLLLARHGMDIGQLSHVEDRTRLTGHDRESFYQLLDAASRIAAEELNQHPPTLVDVTELLQRPELHRGRQFSLIGTVRRVNRIVVGDVDIVKRFGIDHYFEIELFTVPEVTVRFVDSEGHDKVFHRYPVTVCIREIPDWLPTGEGLHTDVEVSGFFLKHWAYRSKYMSDRASGRSSKKSARRTSEAPTAAAPRTSIDDQPDSADPAAAFSGERLQISPLLIGTRVQTFQAPTYTRGNSLLGIAFAGLIVAVVVFAWIYERNAHSRRRRRPEFAEVVRGVAARSDDQEQSSLGEAPHEDRNPHRGVASDSDATNAGPNTMAE